MRTVLILLLLTIVPMYKVPKAPAVTPFCNEPPNRQSQRPGPPKASSSSASSTPREPAASNA